MEIYSNNDEPEPQPQPLVFVVEYLETSMSRELLCKFPDNSAFGFDYSQSSIWSPLLPHPPVNSCTDQESRASFGHSVSRKLLYDEDDHVGLLGNTKKMTARFKRKFTNVVFDNLSKYQKIRKRKRKSLGFSSVPSSHQLNSTPTPGKGCCAKLLKAASKHFKKTSKKREIPLNS